MFVLFASLAIAAQVHVGDATADAVALREGGEAFIKTPSAAVLNTDSTVASCTFFPAEGLFVRLDPKSRALVSGDGVTCTEEGTDVRCTKEDALVVLCERQSLPEVPEVAVAEAKPRVFVFTFEAKEETQDSSKVLNDLVAAELSSGGAYDVVTSADVESMIEQEVRKQAAGCDEAACLSELAGMVGADYIVSGAVRVDERTALVADLSMVGAEDAKQIGQVSFAGRNIEKAAARTPLAVEHLTKTLTGANPPPIPEPYLGRTTTSTSALLGAGAVGAALVPASIVLCALTTTLYIVNTAPGGVTLPGPVWPFFFFLPLLPASAALIVPLADYLAGATPDWKKAVAVAVSVGLSTAIALGLAVTLGLTATSVYALAAGVPIDTTEQQTALNVSPLGQAIAGSTFVVASGVATAFVGAAGAGAYIAAINVFGDEPLEEAFE